MFDLLKRWELTQGDILDNESLVEAIKQVDVVISTVGGHMIPYQHKILSAIKQAGNVKVTFLSPLSFLYQTCSIFCHGTMPLMIVTAICVLLVDWKILSIKKFVWFRDSFPQSSATMRITSTRWSQQNQCMPRRLNFVGLLRQRESPIHLWYAISSMVTFLATCLSHMQISHLETKS